MKIKKIYLGLPAYNEEASINPLFIRVESLQKKIPEKIYVMVYDDGCIDNTRDEVKAWESRLSIIYIDGQVNKGLGAGMSALMAEFASRGKSDAVLVVMDCDDTHDPEQISSMLKVLENKPTTDVVIASRYRLGATISGVPFYRVVLSIGAAMLYKMVHPIWNVRDYTCGYRAYRLAVVQRAFAKYGDPLLKERGFACMVELLLKIARVGANVQEIPLALAYDNKLSASKMDVSGNAFRLLKKLITWRLRGLV
jgi:dolichol-phosphate mannosyltransferase